MKDFFLASFLLEFGTLNAQSDCPNPSPVTYSYDKENS